MGYDSGERGQFAGLSIETRSRDAPEFIRSGPGNGRGATGLTAPATNPGGAGQENWKESMQSRYHGHAGAYAQGASARRRIRRTSHGSTFYCSTNGCTTYLVPDATSGLAICPVCGARRRLH